MKKAVNGNEPKIQPFPKFEGFSCGGVSCDTDRVIRRVFSGTYCAQFRILEFTPLPFSRIIWHPLERFCKCIVCLSETQSRSNIDVVMLRRNMGSLLHISIYQRGYALSVVFVVVLRQQ